MAKRNSRTLTEASIGKLTRAPKGKRVEYFDALQPGLALRVSESGGKSWSVFYRIEGGRNRRSTLGRWPAMGVKAAREAAAKIKALAEEGKDPAAAKEVEKAEAERKAAAEKHAKRSFAAVAETYFAQKCRPAPGRKMLRRGWEIEQIVKRELMPLWGSRPIGEIGRADVSEMIDGKMAHQVPAAANRLLEIVKSLFNWSIDKGFLDSNPAARMKSPGMKEKRERFLDADEIKRLWTAAGEVGSSEGVFVQVLLATGQRRTEVSDMRWSELNLDEKLWTLPPERCKSAREHQVPLSDLAVSLLDEIPTVDDSDFVFVGRHGGKSINGFSKLKDQLDTLSGVDGWTYHDLRRTAATHMTALGVSQFDVGRVLNHVQREITSVYDRHSYGPQKRRALDIWGAELSRIIGGGPAGGNVVELRDSVA